MSTGLEQDLDISPAELQELFELPAFELDKGYRLVAHDDDATGMEFVTVVFIVVLKLTPERAVELMLRIHNHGRAEVYTGTEEECNEKKLAIQALNLKHDQNLFVTVEKID